MKSLAQSIYSQLPETAETQFAKTVSELQSEVRRAKRGVLIKHHGPSDSLMNRHRNKNSLKMNEVKAASDNPSLSARDLS